MTGGVTGEPQRPLLLIADDDEVARELLAETLGREGYRVRVAGGG